MHTPSVDLHLLSCVLIFEELVLAILNDNDCLGYLRYDYGELIDEETINELAGNVEMLELMVSVEELIALFVVGEVEHEAFVD